jgi:arylamine N-acetyltransferase
LSFSFARIKWKRNTRPELDVLSLMIPALLRVLCFQN